LTRIFLPISFCLTFFPFAIVAENAEHQNLFALDISDKEASKVLDFLETIGISDTYKLGMSDFEKDQGNVMRTLIEQVYLYNPDILIAQDDIDIAKEGRTQALGAMLPKVNSNLSASARREKFISSFFSSPSTTTAGNQILTDRFARGSLNVTQPLFRGGTLYKNFQKSKENLESIKFAREAVLQNLFLNAIITHLDVLENLAITAVSKHSLEVLKKFQLETEARFKTHLVTRTDVSQSNARLNRGRADFDLQLTKYKKAREDFERIVGIPANASANIPKVIFQELLEFDELEKIVLLYHPLILEAQKQADAAKREIEARFGVLLPSADLVVEGVNNFKTGYGSTKYSGEAKVQLDIPIYSGGVDFSAYKQAKIEYRRALNQLDRVRREIRDNLNSVKYDYDIAIQVIDARFEEVKAAGVAFDGAQKEMKVGRRTVLDTLDLETNLLNANIEYISASFNRKKVIFQYLDAIGCLNYKILMQAIH